MQRSSVHDATALALLQAAAAAGAAALLAPGEGRAAAVVVLVGSLAGAAAARLAVQGGPGASRAVFLTEATERWFDALVLGTLSWLALTPVSRVGALAVAALGAGAVVAYLRARGRGLGYAVPLWPWYRTARGVLLAGGLLLELLEPALWAVLALDAVVGGARWSFVARQGATA